MIARGHGDVVSGAGSATPFTLSSTYVPETRERSGALEKIAHPVDMAADRTEGATKKHRAMPDNFIRLSKILPLTRHLHAVGGKADVIGPRAARSVSPRIIEPAAEVRIGIPKKLVVAVAGVPVVHR